MIHTHTHTHTYTHMISIPRATHEETVMVPRLGSYIAWSCCFTDSTKDCVCMHVYVYVCTCLHECKYAKTAIFPIHSLELLLHRFHQRLCMYACICVYVRVYMHANTQKLSSSLYTAWSSCFTDFTKVCLYIPVAIYTYMHAYIYIYIYIYIHTHTHALQSTSHLPARGETWFDACLESHSLRTHIHTYAHKSIDILFTFSWWNMIWRLSGVTFTSYASVGICEKTQILVYCHSHNIWGPVSGFSTVLQ